MANSSRYWDVVEVGLCNRIYLDRRWPISNGEAHTLLLGKSIKQIAIIQVQVWGDPGPIDLTCIGHVRSLTSAAPAAEDDLTVNLTKLSIKPLSSEQELTIQPELRVIGPDTLIVVHTLLGRENENDQEASLEAKFYQRVCQLPYMQQRFSCLLNENYSRIIVYSEQGDDCCMFNLIKTALGNTPCFTLYAEDVLFSKTRPERILEDLFYAAYLTNGIVLLDEAESVWSEPEPISEYWQMYCSLVSVLNEYPTVPVICLGRPVKFISSEMKLNRSKNDKLGDLKEIELRSPLGIQEWSFLFKELFAFEHEFVEQLAAQSSGTSIREVCEAYCETMMRLYHETDNMKWSEFKKRMMEMSQSQKARVTIGTDVPFTFIPATTTRTTTVTTSRVETNTDESEKIKIELHQYLNEFCPTVIGQLQAKRALFECLILPRLFPTRMNQLGLKRPIRGIVLYGPPGAGKTMLVAAASQQAGFHLLSVSASDLVRGDVGATEKRVSKLFSLARSCAPCVLFFDEADGLLANRNDAGPNGKKMVAQFLLEMDELCCQHANDDDHIMIIAATNSLEKVDVSFFRPGRLERRVKVGKLSTKEEMIQAFHSLSKGKDECFSKMDWNSFVQAHFMELNKNEGLTGAQIGQILMRSRMECENRRLPSSSSAMDVADHPQSFEFFVNESDVMLAFKQELNGFRS